MTFSTFYWVVFPAIFWGAALGIHVIAYIQYLSAKALEGGKFKSRKERAIEKELQKIRKKQEIE
jgi:hypothetical protein